MSVCSAQNTTVTSDKLPTNSMTHCGVSQKNTCKLITRNTHAYSHEDKTLSPTETRVLCVQVRTHIHVHAAGAYTHILTQIINPN